MKATAKKVVPLASTRWLKFEKVLYVDRKGVEREWDRVSRTTTKASSANPDKVDAVAVLTILKKSNEKNKILLVKQYRPPIDSYTLEMPAGLIDENESADTAALRELKEETGYVGHIEACSPPVVLCPGVCTETIKVVRVTVDLDLPVNANPVQSLEESEDIELVTLPCDDLHLHLEAQAKEGVKVFDGVWTFAMGLQMAKTLLH